MLIAQQIPEAQFSWIYLAEAILFLGIAIGIIKWIRKTLFELSPDSRPTTARERVVLESIDNEAAKHLIERGLISTEQLSEMSDRERMMLLMATAKQIGAPPPTSVASPPIRPAQTVSLHCPLCGAALTPAPQPIPYMSKCESCQKRVHIRADGVGRVSVVVSDPPASENDK
ncbi:MAG TPA: hypothetical protein VJR92_14175 [Gemmatimonadaceae bacterium]|nr:hypothetical protein [Gemmatimonadaceae bacterium]